MRRCRLSKPGKVNTAAKIGVLAVNGCKPILSSSKKEIVGLPGLFDADGGGGSFSWPYETSYHKQGHHIFQQAWFIYGPILA